MMNRSSDFFDKGAAASPRPPTPPYPYMGEPVGAEEFLEFQKRVEGLLFSLTQRVDTLLPIEHVVEVEVEEIGDPSWLEYQPIENVGFEDAQPWNDPLTPWLYVEFAVKTSVPLILGEAVWDLKASTYTDWLKEVLSGPAVIDGLSVTRRPPGTFVGRHT